VNDQFGHEEGDRVIVAVADMLQESMRETDLVCRWGGEEFRSLPFGTELEGPANWQRGCATKSSTPSSCPAGGGHREHRRHAGRNGCRLRRVLGTADRELYRARPWGAIGSAGPDGRACQRSFDRTTLTPAGVAARI